MPGVAFLPHLGGSPHARARDPVSVPSYTYVVCACLARTFVMLKGASMTQANGRSTTRHTTGSQPDTDARGRDRYSERDEEATNRAFPGTFVTRDKVEPAIVARDGGLVMIDPRPYASLLFDSAGAPIMAPQMLTFLAGPDPKRGTVKRLITALESLKDRDERGYGMLVARYDDGHSYRRIGTDYGVCHATAHATILRCVEQLTDWVSAAEATELEQAALTTGSLDGDDEDGDEDGAADLAEETPPAAVAHARAEEQSPAVVVAASTTSTARVDAGERAPAPLDAYWRAVERRRARDAYERGA